MHGISGVLGRKSQARDGDALNTSSTKEASERGEHLAIWQASFTNLVLALTLDRSRGRVTRKPSAEAR
jgi:hypothetical protein